MRVAEVEVEVVEMAPPKHRKTVSGKMPYFGLTKLLVTENDKGVLSSVCLFKALLADVDFCLFILFSFC